MPVPETPATVTTDVFISYAHEDRPLARQLAEALEAGQVSVWWDRDLAAGSEFALEIESRLQHARVVMGLWSVHSVQSAFVRDECSRALRAGKLVPVRIEDIELPLGFGQTHTLDLLDWDGDADDEGFRQLLQEVRQRKGVAPVPLPGPRGLSGLGVFRLRRHTWLVAVALLSAGLLGYGGWSAWDKTQKVETNRRNISEADRHFRAGLQYQFAREPELVSALNEYLSALELRPKHARAQYYLAHVYVQNGRPEDALRAFQSALVDTEAPLDPSLRAEAGKQIAALSPTPNEAKAVARADRPAAPTALATPKITSPAGPQAAAAAAAAPAAPARTPAARVPVRLPPSPEKLTALADRVDDMFKPDKDKRVAATTGLIVDPIALSDAVPLALDKALQALHSTSPALTAANSSGIVNTLVLLRSAPPGTLAAQRVSIEALLMATEGLGDTTRAQADKVRGLMQQAAGRRPVIYLQIANEAQRPMAQALAQRFRDFGYDVPGLELVGVRAPDNTEVRVQGKSERGYARWVAGVVGQIANRSNGGKAPSLSTLHNAKPATDTYEVWLGRTLCAPGSELAPGCQGTVQ
ncbi:MAG: TIR domain-containing protein [Polaromonas sp.]